MTTMHATAGDRATIAVLPIAPAPSIADEINHRIANSLQLLSAMVSVEARGIDDPAALAALDMTQRRIGAIASVHRHLYRAQGTAMIDLGAYLSELGGDLELGCANATAGRGVIVHAAPVMVSAEEATAIGIIVSELVGNACKYAYAPGEPGDVRITLNAAPFGGYILTVEDRGRGLSGHTVRGTGLGGRLIETMAAKLGGRHDYHDARPGTRFALSVGKRRAAA